MENQLQKEVQEKAKIRAQKNIEDFLKELDTRKSRSEEDIYSLKTYEGEAIKILDDYERRRKNVKNRWEELKELAKRETKDGYLHLSAKEKYKIIVKRRCEAEKILIEAHLGPQDTNKLKNELVNNIVEIYDIYGLHKLDKNDGEEETSGAK